jgi:hypothetical protein
MKISDAINILNIKNYNITNIQHISYDELKKQYHIQSLIYHPDKNSDYKNATLIFQNINCAFVTLKDLISNNDSSANNLNDDLSDDDSYNNLLINFINYVINYHNNSVLNSTELDDLKLEADKQLSKLLETLFSNFPLIIVEDIYLALLKFNNTRNIELVHTDYLLKNKIISIIKKICVSILEKNDIYIISPTISNLLNSDIYKLTIANDYVYVPLWHRELAFENAIIKIYPILDSAITLEYNNTIHYTYKNKFSLLLEAIAHNNNNICIAIDNNNYTININMLKMTKYQVYIIENQGIPIINVNNILDNSIKGSIVFHIYLD